MFLDWEAVWLVKQNGIAEFAGTEKTFTADEKTVFGGNEIELNPYSIYIFKQILK